MRQSLRMLKLLLAVLVICPATGAYALTASEIISRARTFLRDTSSSAARQRYSDTQLLGFLNDCQREANSFAWILRSSYTFTLSGGTTEYALPSDFQATWRATYKNRKLDQTSQNELDAKSINWQAVSGEVNSYYIYIATSPWIGFYPAPVASSTGTATVHYLQSTTDMTSTSETPWNAWRQLSPYHSGLSYCVAHRGLWTIGDPLADKYLAEWNQWISVMKFGIMQTPDFNPGFQGRREE